MNRQVKILLGCVAALLVLLGALAAALLAPKPDEGTAGEEAVALSIGQVSAVTLSGGEGTVKVVRDGDGFAVEGLEGLPLSENAAALAGQAEALEAVREITPADDLSRFGLDAPETTATIETAEGVHTLALGDPSPVSGERYAALDGKVYLMKEAGLSAFGYGPEDFVSTLVSDPLDADAVVETVELRRGEETISMTYVPEEAAESPSEEASSQAQDNSVPAYYRMTAPVAADVELFSVSVWANGAFGLNAQAVAAIRPEQSDLARYGLDAPETAVTLTSSTGETLRLSASAPRDGVCYLLREGVPLIYRVSQTDVGWRTATAETLTGSVFLPLDEAEVSTLTVEGQGERYAFTREGGTVKAGGKTVPAERFDAVLDAALGIPPEFLGETARPALEPALTITVAYGDAARSSDTLRLIPTGSGSLYLELNGEARFTARESYADALLRACAEALSEEPEEP